LHIHISGICGTFMGGVALLAKQMGHQVSGSDENIYPPMSTQLEENGIILMKGYNSKNLEYKPDLVVIGNALSRGNPEIEEILNQGFPYISGPQWLGEYCLKDRWVLAVAGTHGKTTSSSMLAWILEYADLNPGFLIGGIPLNFGLSARLGEKSGYFVVEADEYDTAFFDKRSKFVHYHPRTLVINNLEYDHADIFPDIESIKRQFHHLLRTVPGNGLIISPNNDINLKAMFEMGSWTGMEYTDLDTDTSADWSVKLNSADCSSYDVYYKNVFSGTIGWELTGEHNVYNALSAIAAAKHVGVNPDTATKALNEFKNVKRRMEIRAVVNGITIYEDFAHHPTAIETTLKGLRAKVKTNRIIAILETRSNTMRSGYHADTLPEALKSADIAIVYQPPGNESSINLEKNMGNILSINSIDAIVETLKLESKRGDTLIFMSNGSFSGIYDLVEAALR